MNKDHRQLERTEVLIEYFSLHPCVDCGERDPIVLEFDHLRDKEFSIGHKLAVRPWEKIVAEIEKCEVVLRELPPAADRDPAWSSSCEVDRQVQNRQRTRRTGPSALPVVGEPIGANRF